MMPTHDLEKKKSRQSQTAGAMPFDRGNYPSLAEFLQGEADAGTLAEKVYDQILIRIIRGELASQSELKSTRLATEMGVSRTPVVQALARLLADGIVTQQTHHRAVVRPGAENWLVDIHALRQQIEPLAARAAAGRISSDVIQDLQTLAEDCQSTKGTQWRTATRYFDYALHLSVAEFCGNLAVRETIRKCWLYKRVSYDAVSDTQTAVRRGFEEHLEILHHLSAPDGDAAFDAMQNHLAKANRYRVHQRIV